MGYLNILKPLLCFMYGASFAKVAVEIFRITPYNIGVAPFVLTYVDNDSAEIASAKRFSLAPLLDPSD